MPKKISRSGKPQGDSGAPEVAMASRVCALKLEWQKVQTFYVGIQSCLSDAEVQQRGREGLPVVEASLNTIVELLRLDKEEATDSIYGGEERFTTSSGGAGPPKLPPCYCFLLGESPARQSEQAGNAAAPGGQSPTARVPRSPRVEQGKEGVMMTSNRVGACSPRTPRRGKSLRGKSSDSAPEQVATGAVDAAAAGEGAELILSLCQYAKQDSPVGSRQVILRFLTRFLNEADLFPPQLLARPRRPDGEVAATGRGSNNLEIREHVVSAIERGFQSIPSLLELYEELVTVPLIDVIRKVGHVLHPANESTEEVLRGEGEEGHPAAYLPRSDTGLPHGQIASRGGAQSLGGATGPTTASRYQDRLEFVRLLSAIARKIELRREVAHLFMYPDKAGASAAEQCVAQVASQAAADAERRGAVIPGPADHEPPAVAREVDGHPLVHRLLPLDYLEVYTRDYALGLCLPQREAASWLALEAALALARCPNKQVQDTVSRETAVAHTTVAEFRTTLLTLCKVPQNRESRVQLAYLLDLLRFWGVLLLRAPRVAQAWDLENLFTARIARETVLSLLRAPEHRVYSSMAVLFATMVREVGGITPLVLGLVKTLFEARVDLKTGSVLAVPSSQAADTSSFLDEHIVVKLVEAERLVAAKRLNAEAQTAMEATLMLLNSIATVAPYHFLKFALHIPMESLGGVRKKFKDLVNRAAPWAGARRSESPSADPPGPGDEAGGKGELPSPCESHHVAIPTELRVDKSQRRMERRRAFVAYLHSCGLCTAESRYVTLSAHVAAPPILLEECFPARLKRVSGGSVCGSTEDAFCRDVLEKLLAIEAHVPAALLVQRQRDLQLPIDARFLAVGDEGAEESARGSSGMGPHQSSPDGWRGSTPSPTAPVVPLARIVGRGRANIWFHPSTHQASTVTAICSLLSQMIDLPMAVNLQLTELITTICLLPDLRVLYTLMDTEHGRLHHSLHKLASLIDNELDEDELLQVATAAAAVAAAARTGPLSSHTSIFSWARGSHAKSEEQPVPVTHADPRSVSLTSPAVPDPASSASGAVEKSSSVKKKARLMKHVGNLEHSRLQLCQWYFATGGGSAAGPLSFAVDRSSGGQSPAELSLSPQTNESNAIRSRKEDERDALFAEAFARHRTFVEACACLEGLRVELGAVVAYMVLSHNFLGLQSSP